MLGIKAIASYFPERQVSNLERADESGKDVEFLTDKVGFTNVLRKAENEETSDLCVKAFEALLEKVPDLDRESIDCVIVVTQNPDGFGLPHTSAIVQHKLGLPEEVAAFDISLGCSGFVYGLDVIQSLMASQGLRHGLLFTADPYSKVMAADDYDTQLLFGDAAAVTYIGEDTGVPLGEVDLCHQCQAVPLNQGR